MIYIYVKNWRGRIGATRFTGGIILIGDYCFIRRWEKKLNLHRLNQSAFISLTNTARMNKAI